MDVKRRMNDRFKDLEGGLFSAVMASTNAFVAFVR